MMHLNDKLKDACFQTAVRAEHWMLNHLENEVLDDPMMAFGTIGEGKKTRSTKTPLLDYRSLSD